jgi:inositol transporter-like SP family MFS transporter
MVVLLVISLVVGLLGMPNTRGRSLDDITRERYGDNY